MDAADERRRELERRLGLSKAHGMILGIVFFMLTALGVVAMFFLFDEMQMPKGLATAIACIGLAELLIHRFQFHGTGVESALWTGGLFAFIFGIPGQGKPEALLLFALACAIAGRRLRNPLIGGATAIFVIAYFGVKGWSAAALIAGIALASIALVARAREWQRPSTEGLFLVLLFVTPVAGAVATAAKASLLWGFAYVALAAAEFAFGERKRDRVALIAGCVSLVIAVVVMRDVFDFLAIEWKLIAAGALMFGVAIAVSRALRDNKRGFVVTPVKHAYEEALRIFGTVAFAPHHAAQAETAPQPVGSGGSFGGAGATGDY